VGADSFALESVVRRSRFPDSQILDSIGAGSSRLLMRRSLSRVVPRGKTLETLSAMVPAMSAHEPETVSIGMARNNLTEVTSKVRLQDRPIVLAQRGKPQVVLFPLEMLEAVQAAGGYEKALEVLRQHAATAKAD
jgi:prevent-host-death family protein